MATIRDVAQHAGVSPATVSRVVNGLVGYSEETRQRVEEAVVRLNYETDSLARGLKTRQTSVIGLLAPMVSDALASEVMRGVEEAARELGYAVMLGRTGSQSVFIDGYLRTLRTYRAAGVILISAVIRQQMRQLLGPNIPIISVAISDGSGSPSVSIDDERAAYDATRYLLHLGTCGLACLLGTRHRSSSHTPVSVATNGPWRKPVTHPSSPTERFSTTAAPPASMTCCGRIRTSRQCSR